MCAFALQSVRLVSHWEHSPTRLVSRSFRLTSLWHRCANAGFCTITLMISVLLSPAATWPMTTSSMTGLKKLERQNGHLTNTEYILSDDEFYRHIKFPAERQYLVDTSGCFKWFKRNAIVKLRWVLWLKMTTRFIPVIRPPPQTQSDGEFLKWRHKVQLVTDEIVYWSNYHSPLHDKGCKASSQDELCAILGCEGICNGKGYAIERGEALSSQFFALQKII